MLFVGDDSVAPEDRVLGGQIEESPRRNPDDERFAQISGHARKLDAYTSIATLLNAPDDSMRRLKKLTDKARGLAERRNRVVHDPWLLISPRENARRFEITARQTLRVELVLQPTKDVQALATSILKLHGEFVTLNADIRDACTLPETADEESPR